MTNWKDFERKCAAMIGGIRYPANMGGYVDVESEEIVAQCKEVKQLPLAEMARIVLKIEAEGVRKFKLGVLFAKSHEGRGRPTLPLVIMRMESWWLDRRKGREAIPDVESVGVRRDDGACPHCGAVNRV